MWRNYRTASPLAISPRSNRRPANLSVQTAQGIRGLLTSRLQGFRIQFADSSSLWSQKDAQENGCCIGAVGRLIPVLMLTIGKSKIVKPDATF
jgi:hypothetical protein